MVDVDKLSDAELRTKLLEYGFPVMPITGTTRKVMAKKLKMLMENKEKIGGSGGRRSMGRYSSEEDSDVDITPSKKKENRRATMAAPIMQPPSSSSRSRKSMKVNDSSEHQISGSPTKREVKTSSITTTTTSRTQKITRPTIQDEFDTGSDSESDLLSNNYRSSPLTSGIGDYYTRESPTKNLSSKSMDISYGGGNSQPFMSSSRYNSPSLASEYAADRLNQIRSRLSLGAGGATSSTSGYDKPVYSTTLDKEETPFLSNFTRHLSALSSSQKADEYKNDVIKEHDTNGGTLFSLSRSSRPTLAASRSPSSYSYRYGSQQQKSTTWSASNAFLKNNFVSFAVLAAAALFFIFLAIAYLGMRSDTTMVPAGSIIPYCRYDDPSFKKGVNCLDEEEVSDAFNLLAVLRPELHRRSVASKCDNSATNRRLHMTEADIIHYCLEHFNIKESQVKRDLKNLEILIFNNPKWGLNVLQLYEDKDTVTEEDVAKNMEHVLFNEDRMVIGLVELKAELPWSCTIYNGFRVTLTASLAIAAVVLLLYGSQWAYRRYKRYEQMQRRELSEMVERIIEILQQANGAGDEGDDEENGFVVINHVRDMILPVSDRKEKEKLWQKAIKFINENESRVRTEVQVVKGEPFEVWRWIGTSNLSMSGCKYRHGRRIVDVHYVITETLKFRHKRLRFCKSTDVEIKGELREGFTSILLLKCKSCGKEHPVCTEEPDTDLMNVNLAFVSGVISLGLSLYGLNELCSALRIPTVSGKEYNLYLDEIFEIYKDSTKGSDNSKGSKGTSMVLRSSTPKGEHSPVDGILTAIMPKIDESKVSSNESMTGIPENDVNITGRVLRSSTPKYEEKKREQFLRHLQKTPEQIKKLSEQTKDQKDCPVWMEERKKRLTASNFGRICKLLTSTNRHKVAEEMLNSTFTGNEYTKYGNDHEAQAVKDFEKTFGQEVISCGLYIHPEHPYLAASPDGLLGTDALVEIKCPFKARDSTPEEAIHKKLVTFATLENGVFRLKRSDKYYYQVQGQLQVTGRKECYFVMWTPRGLMYDKVERNDAFWRDEMMPKLKEFYFGYMLPKMLECI